MNELLSIDGVLLTMFDGRLNLSRQVAADAREYFGPKVYSNVIPRNVRLAEAPSFGKPIILYDVTSAGALAYMAAAKEMLRRHWSAAHAGTHAGTHASSTRRRDHAAAAATAPADIAPAAPSDSARASTADTASTGPTAGENPGVNPGDNVGGDDARGAAAGQEARGDGRTSGIVPESTALNAR